MGFFNITRNDISPALSRLAGTARNPTPVLRAMGTTFKSITEGNFSQIGQNYRPIPWPNKRDGSKSILSLHGVLNKSFALEVTNTYARLSNPTIYAAIHQFGGTIKAKAGGALRFKTPQGTWVTVKQVVIPARPFYPVLNDMLTPAAETKIGNAARRVIESQAAA